MRDEYAKLYGPHVEERSNTGPLPVVLARAKHREWLSEIEARMLISGPPGKVGAILRRKTPARSRANGITGTSPAKRIVGLLTFGTTITRG